MKTHSLNWLSFGLIVCAFGLASALYQRLPDPVPTHWNAGGDADGFASKPVGAFLIPLAMVCVSLVFVVIRKVSPRGYRLEASGIVLDVIQFAILSFLLFVTAAALFAGIGISLPMARLTNAGIGLLFVVLGGCLGRIKRNFFLGIRTPWTLADAEVWSRTHQFGGRVLASAGLGQLVSGLLWTGSTSLVVATAVAAGVPAVYSYIIYRRIHPPNERTPRDPT